MIWQENKFGLLQKIEVLKGWLIHSLRALGALPETWGLILAPTRQFTMSFNPSSGGYKNPSPGYMANAHLWCAGINACKKTNNHKVKNIHL